MFNYFNDYNEVWKTFADELSAIQPKITAKNSAATDELLQYNEKDNVLNSELLKAFQQIFTLKKRIIF